jgi:putative metallohydrolase (TIGR04338 family)
LSLGYWIVERVEVGKARKNGGSVGAYEKDKNAGRIEMAPVHWNELFVLHELAHVLAKALYESKSHDPAFARTYLQLVFCVMGSTTYEALQSRFNQLGVVYDFKTLPESRFALSQTKEN